jgi:CTP synthase
MSLDRASSFALIHVSMVPVIHGEQKTKPTQASIRDLRGFGLTPDLVRTIALNTQDTLQTIHADRLPV